MHDFHVFFDFDGVFKSLYHLHRLYRVGGFAVGHWQVEAVFKVVELERRKRLSLFEKLRIGFRAALLYEVVGVEPVGERHHADVKPGFAQYVESSQRCGLPRAVTVVAYIHVGRIVAD